ncbi:hypothetical protein L6R50_19120 [Myxococcota bacterium]|nr:hypothetical protein [Myxococcota bacterium]
MPVSRKRQGGGSDRKSYVKTAPKAPPTPSGRFENPGPYAEAAPAHALGRDLSELESSPFFVLGGFKLRKMVGRDRIYTNGETFALVGVDAERRVTQVVVSLLPSAEDHPDESYRVAARGPGGQPVALSYQWAMLVHLAHGVIGLGARDASELLTRIFQPGYLPIERGGVRVDLVSGQFLGGPERVALGIRRADAPEYTGAAAP